MPLVSLEAGAMTRNAVILEEIATRAAMPNAARHYDIEA